MLLDDLYCSKHFELPAQSRDAGRDVSNMLRLSMFRNAAIKDMASNLERKWRQMVNVQKDGTSSKSEGDDIEDVKTKKRKLAEPPAKAAPPAKKIAVTAAPSSSKPTIVKKEAKAVVTSVKDAKSDSSFFSAPKPKPKLPSFKKALASVKKELDQNVAQPSAIDPFQEALKDMAKARKGLLLPLPHHHCHRLRSRACHLPLGLPSPGRRRSR